MKRVILQLTGILFLLFTNHASATVRYVALNSPNATPPFTDWSTAATNIQDAIDTSVDGDTVIVTNGVYAVGGKSMDGVITNRVSLDKAATVRSVNGPFVTFIQGAGATNGNTAVRCAWLTNGASLIGFTLQGGATRTSGNVPTLVNGGAFWCASSNALVANCVISNNTAAAFGVAYQGTMHNCLVSGNNSIPAYTIHSAKLVNCTVINNRALAMFQCTATNCIIRTNTFGNYSGGTFSYCCTTPLPTGIGNIDFDPNLLSDFIHLANPSPCINAGINLTTGTDIFGQVWRNPPSIGCCQWQVAPTIFIQPAMKLTAAPIGFSISLLALGQDPLICYWTLGGTPIENNGHYSSAHSTNLLVSGLSQFDAGNYQVVVSNAFGSVTSAVVQVVSHFVNNANMNPIAPFSTWSTAAVNIQDAVDVAAAGDFVVVTNGLYTTGGRAMPGDVTNRVALNKPIAVMSVNGPLATAIQGAWDPVSTNGPGAVRCAWLADGAALYGFTLRNGATRSSSGFVGTAPESGGGAWCNSTNGVVSNCVLTNDSASWGGGIANGTLNNSIILNCLAGGSGYGGGAFYATLNNCLVLNNYNTYRGAGTYDCIVHNSIVLGNYPGPIYFGNESNYYYDGLVPLSYSFSCTYPAISGTGNINGYAANLQFLDLYHIASTSPCRGAGSALFAAGTDLDGEPWASPPSMGCDEVVSSNLVGPLSVQLQTYQNITTVLTNRYGIFYGNVTGRASGVAWSFGDGPAITNFGAGTVNHTWTNIGDYNVTFAAYNNDNPAGVSTNLLMHVIQAVPTELQGATLLTNGFQFTFTGQPSVNYAVQYATNLAPSATWQTLQSLNYSGGQTYQITDLSATNGARFYRVKTW